MPAQTVVFHLQGEHDQQTHAGGGAQRGGDRTGHPEVDAVIEGFLDEPLGDWTTDDTKIGDMDASRCAGACDAVAEQFTEYATERGLKVYTTRTSVDEMGYEVTGDPAGQVLDDDGNIVDGFYQEHTVNQVYIDGQGWPLTIDFTARQYGYDTPVKTDPAVREEDLAVEVFHLQGQHNQKDHGNRGAGAPIEDLVGGSDGYSPKHQGYFGEIAFGRYHGTEDTGVYSVTVQEHGTSSGWENDKYDVAITTDEDGNMIAAEVTRRVTRNDIGNPEMSADDLNTLFEEHGVELEWGEAVVDGRRVPTAAQTAQEAREDAYVDNVAATYDAVYDAYNFSITDKRGEEYFVSADPTVDTPGGGNANGIITDWEGNVVGRFDRNVDLEFGRVDNDSFQVEPAWQGRGIGTAFLDRSEAALADAGVERSRLTAVDVGRYAWMARGYQVSRTDRASVVRQWVPEVESILSSREFTDVQRSQARAVVRSWESGDDVYGADLLSVSDEFADVFLNGPTYTASRELTPSPRARAWVDPNQLDLDLSLEVFHLQGQHNQKDHGRRGGASSPLDALDASDIPVMTDEYGELLIESTGVDRIRQIAYDYDGGSDVYDVVIVDNGDGTIAVDVENLYGPDGTVEGEQALERYLNDNGIDDVRWDGERGTLHASHRAAVMAGDATAAQELLVKVEDVYDGSFEVGGQEYVIGETRVYMREGDDNPSVEIRGSIMEGDVTGKEVGQFSRAVFADGTVYNHSLSIDRNFQGQGIGTAFLEQTEGALQPEVIKLAAANVGKYAWAARGYKLDVDSGSSLAAATRDRWIFEARNALSNTPEWRAGDFTTIDKLAALERAWMDDLNSVYPADLLAIDSRLKSVLLEGPSWDAIKRRDDPLAAAAGVEVFHLQGQHDQQSHAGGRGGDGLGYDPHTEVPPQRPGEAEIPEGAVRLTHRTWSNNVDSIMENGLGGEHARQYDFEGEVVWAAAGVAYGQEEIGGPWQAESDITFFEFWMMPDELIIGRGDDPAQLESRSSHVTMSDVPPERFVGVYEPWHAAYWAFESRTAGTFEEVKSGFYDSVGEANPDTYGKAMDYIKREDLAVETLHLQGQHDQQSHAGGRGKAGGGVLGGDRPEPGINLDPDASWAAPFHERIVIDGQTHRDVPMEKWRAMVKHQGAIDAASTLSVEEQDAIVTELESDGLKNALGARDAALLGYGESLLEGVDPETSMKVSLPLTFQLSHLQAADSAGLLASSDREAVRADARFVELADAIQDSDASWESNQDMSNYIAERWGITPVTGVFHSFNKGWQDSSRSARSLAVQAEVADRFRLDSGDFDEFVALSRPGVRVWAEYIRRRLPKTVSGYVDGTYNRTQEFLAETRAPEVGLYRGIRGDTYTPTAGTEINGNPISSWSQSEPIAYQFATDSFADGGRVLTDYAPREDVFSIAAVTGMGAVHEHEVILLGRTQTLDVVEEIS